MEKLQIISQVFVSVFDGMVYVEKGESESTDFFNVGVRVMNFTLSCQRVAGVHLSPKDVPPAT